MSLEEAVRGVSKEIKIPTLVGCKAVMKLAVVVRKLRPVQRHGTGTNALAFLLYSKLVLIAMVEERLSRILAIVVTAGALKREKHYQ